MVARQDLAQNPDLKSALRTARRGTVFFGRKLNELSDDELAAPSLLPGWTRAHVVAHVG
ncbi:maleylpyruvate isomerase N-terminal domain-containing protein, partial [Arthrobacter sp.]|uniref:maleylpyruvate isomerase N-terminal domain-containing protein n=1 Tax=Arthrobacter sp. TaxID=1667 RepID=UPI003392EA11